MTDTVVIVDDSLTVRMDLVEAFEAAGFRTVPCATIAEARLALERLGVGIVVLDVVLPDGDGVELLREIRGSRAGADVPVLMLSTEAEIGDRVRAMKTGADDYVGKPYDRGYLVAKARELLRVRAQPATSSRALLLLIDDSLTFREALREQFEAAGYGVVTAETGEEGLRIAADRRPSAIIVDGELPGIDGPSVIRHVRLDAALRATPCLLLTASEDRGAELRALDAGADAFVRKDEEIEVILARVGATLRRSGPIAVDTASAHGPRKLLAVDDSPTYLHELATTLRGEGYDVVLARSGEQALEVLAVEAVDCIVLDLVMPGLGGQETCRRIKAAPGVRDIPLVILTGNDDRLAMLEALAAGADDFIHKSGDLAVLKARVRAQIRRKQFEDETRHVREQLLRRDFEAKEARSARELAETRAALAGELELKNQELEAFSYSVSHDLRAPLRAVAGFAAALAEDYAAQLDDHARDYLRRIQLSTRRMSDLIDDLLKLAGVGRGELVRQRVDLSELARGIAAQLAEQAPARAVTFAIEPGLAVHADPGLIRAVMENLLGNAFKFTARRAQATIELGTSEASGERVIFVRDDGVGFDRARASELFRPFYRLHAAKDFEGTGIGLATVQRIITRHGGRIWADSAPGQGTTIFFTI